jgi:hypothetical protein
LLTDHNQTCTMRCDSNKFSFNQKNLLHLLTQSPLVARKEGETDADCQSVTRLFVYPALSFALLYQSAVVIKWNTKNLRRHQQMYNSLKHKSYFPFHSPVNIICMYFSSTWPCNLWSYQKRKQLNMHLNLVLKQNKRTCDLIYYGICTWLGLRLSTTQDVQYRRQQRRLMRRRSGGC